MSDAYHCYIHWDLFLTKRQINSLQTRHLVTGLLRFLLLLDFSVV
jgi:hypothetical protein